MDNLFSFCIVPYFPNLKVLKTFISDPIPGLLRTLQYFPWLSRKESYLLASATPTRLFLICFLPSSLASPAAFALHLPHSPRTSVVSPLPPWHMLVPEAFL